MIKNYNNISGLLLVNKPSGVTSFKVTHKIRKILNVRKAGHCGTLDPSATGLLLVLIGKATRLQGSFMKKDKIYTSSFLMGITTDTGDLDGNIISKSSILDVDIEKIAEAVETFRGEILQIPPMYSALKRNGKKLYELARRGIEVERKPRKVTIKQFNILSYKHDILNVKVFCSSGTYIRTLAKDLGDLLGCGATVKTLRRDVIGVFDVKNALSFDDLESLGKIMEKLTPYEKLLELAK
ncbi:MAG: tRNA pseudouridine(55) synthase TruB [Endomicrobium sp.]|nr:tRNA pseudouridine(55) synthase TruB [Endomicrobium sp.]